jgi:hypothetical protein
VRRNLAGARSQSVRREACFRPCCGAWELNNDGCCTIGYADNTNKWEMPSDSIRVLTDISVSSPTWCGKTNLFTNLSKRVSNTFQQEGEFKELEKSALFNMTIRLTSEVEYLELMLD